jgi:Zn ribbon nucleic-acid-binding protein
MFEAFEEVEINAACAKCGHGHRKAVRQLRHEGSFECFACGARISVEDAPIRSALANIEQVREELGHVLECRSIAVR